MIFLRVGRGEANGFFFSNFTKCKYTTVMFIISMPLIRLCTCIVVRYFFVERSNCFVGFDYHKLLLSDFSLTSVNEVKYFYSNIINPLLSFINLTVSVCVLFLCTFIIYISLCVNSMPSAVYLGHNNIKCTFVLVEKSGYNFNSNKKN